MDNELSSEEILRLINQQKIANQRKKIDYQRAVALSVQAITEDERNWIRQVLSADNYDSHSKLTEDELNWLKQVLGKDYVYDSLNLPLSYVRLKKTRYERMANKGIVRKELDALREKLKKITPQELLELRNKNVRTSRGVEDFAGIYIIHNREKDIFLLENQKEYSAGLMSTLLQIQQKLRQGMNRPLCLTF
ncbi:hypothetical protein ASG99_27060 [Bacillus sp. Soil768D1]|nr:hypothetical protein ASG99_27060 [Bacillus sp. Soil768D1]